MVAVDTIDTCAHQYLCRCMKEGADRPTVSLSSRSIFIFAAEVPAAALSPADTILVM